MLVISNSREKSKSQRNHFEKRVASPSLVKPCVHLLHVYNEDRVDNEARRVGLW